jgi:hypothetical protein
LIAVGAAYLLTSIAFKQFLHAWSTAAVLVYAHHHRGILPSIELSHAKKALLFDLVLDEVLYFLAHQLGIDKFHAQSR